MYKAVYSPYEVSCYKDGYKDGMEEATKSYIKIIDNSIQPIKGPDIS